MSCQRRATVINSFGSIWMEFHFLFVAAVYMHINILYAPSLSTSHFHADCFLVPVTFASSISPYLGQNSIRCTLFILGNERHTNIPRNDDWAEYRSTSCVCWFDFVHCQECHKLCAHIDFNYALMACMMNSLHACEFWGESICMINMEL